MNNITILIVEDDLIESIRLEKNLKELGFNVLPIADNVKDALGLFYSTDPDIILIDINLKGEKDGIDLGNQISSDQKNIKPIIYLTSLQDQQSFQRAKQTNPHAYIIKPVDPQLLVHTIELGLLHFDNRKAGVNINLENGILNRESVFVKKGKKMIRLKINQIQYIEVESKYCTLISDNERFLVRIALIELIDFFPSSTFQRINRNYVINLNHVNEFDLEEMTVSLGKTTLPISQKYKKDLMDKMGCLQ